MKVAPVRAEMIATDAVSPEASHDVVLPVTTLPKSVSTGRSGRKRIRIRLNPHAEERHRRPRKRSR